MYFNRKLTAGIGLTPIIVTNPVVTEEAQTIQSLTIANTTAAPAPATITMTDGNIIIHIAKSIIIPAGDSLNVIGPNFNHNLIKGDSISVSSGVPNSLDVLCSYLER